MKRRTLNIRNKTSYTWLVLTLSLIWGITNVSAQSISGRIVDEGGKPIEFANVILKKVDQAEILDLVVSDINGDYQFTALKDSNFIITISMLGFENQNSYVLKIKDADPQTLNFILKQDANLIDGVVVTGTRPKIIQRGGKTVVTLDNQLQAGSNLSSILKKVPGVMVTNSSIRVGASNSVKILINGRNTEYMDIQTLLNEMPAENISQIELIYQPDATYEANGSGPIINVILKNNKGTGTQGSVSNMLGYSDGMIGSIGLNMSSFLNRVRLSGGISYRQGGWTETTEIERKIGDEQYTQYSNNPYRPRTLRTNLDTEYYLNSKHTIGLSLDRVKTRENWQGTSKILISGATGEDLLLTQTNAIENWNYWKVNPYYEWKWNDKEQNYLRFDMRYVNYNPQDEIAFRKLPASNVSFDNPITIQNGLNQTWSFKLDAKKEWNKKHVFKAGAQYDIASLDNDLKNYVDQVSVPETSLDNHFLIDEDIYALYAQYEYNTEKWFLSTGLRWENSDTRGTSVTIDSTLTRKINKLFPSASMSYQINSKIGVGLAYSYRIERPGYYSLNPFMVFYDPLTTDSGNPNLAPELTHSLQLNLQYEKQPFFRIEYKTTDNALFEGVFQDDLTGEITRKSINIDSRTSFSSRLFFPLDFIPHISGYGGVMMNYIDYQSTLPDFNYQNSKWSWIWYHQIEAELVGKVKLETTMWIGTGALEGLIEADWFGGANIEFSRSFLDKKLTLSLEIEDLIPRGNVGQIQYQNIAASVNNRPNFYSIYFRAKYRFGNDFFKSKSKREKSSDGLERLQK